MCVKRRKGEREKERCLRLQQHMLSTQKTYTMPLVNKVVGLPLGANLDSDLRQCRGFMCEHLCVFSACAFCSWCFIETVVLGWSGWPSCRPSISVSQIYTHQPHQPPLLQAEPASSWETLHFHTVCKSFYCTHNTQDGNTLVWHPQIKQPPRWWKFEWMAKQYHGVRLNRRGLAGLPPML